MFCARVPLDVAIARHFEPRRRHGYFPPRTVQLTTLAFRGGMAIMAATQSLWT